MFSSLTVSGKKSHWTNIWFKRAEIYSTTVKEFKIPEQYCLRNSHFTLADTSENKEQHIANCYDLVWAAVRVRKKERTNGILHFP